MEEYINNSLTLEGWMDKVLAGESIDQRDLDTIITIVTCDSEKKVRVLSQKPLNEEKKEHGMGM